MPLLDILLGIRPQVLRSLPQNQYNCRSIKLFPKSDYLIQGSLWMLLNFISTLKFDGRNLQEKKANKWRVWGKQTDYLAENIFSAAPWIPELRLVPSLSSCPHQPSKCASCLRRRVPVQSGRKCGRRHHRYPATDSLFSASYSEPQNTC